MSGSDENSTDDLIVFDPTGSEELENDIDENEVKTIYIEFIKNQVHKSSNNILNPIPSTSKDSESISCNVKYCKSINILNTDLSFFQIPPSVWSSGSLMNKWKQALGKENESLPADFRICQKHFKKEHIEYTRKGKRLNRFAVPCLELPKDDSMPYFSDIDSIEQYIKGSAESYILDMKNRSEDSMECLDPILGVPISVKMEVTEDTKTVVKPVTISAPNPGTIKMFTQPLRRINRQQNSTTGLIDVLQTGGEQIDPKPPEPTRNAFDSYIENSKKYIPETRTKKRKYSEDTESPSQGSTASSHVSEADDDSDKCTIQIINPRATKRSKSICSIRSTNPKESAIQKVKPMQHKVVPIIHNDILAAKKSAHYRRDSSPEAYIRRTTNQYSPAHFPKKTSIAALQDYGRSTFKREREEKVQIKLSGPVTFQLCDSPKPSQETNHFASSIKTEKQLREICGLNNFNILDLLEKFHRDVEDLSDVKSRIILTFVKLKTDISFTFLSTIFGCDESTTQRIFQQTIRILANVFDSIDFDFPKKPDDSNFEHFKFALECLEVQADDENMKVLLKITPNGMVKYLGKNYSNRWPSGFQLTSIEDFAVGDYIWIGRGVMIEDVSSIMPGVNFVTRKKAVNSIQRVVSKINTLKILEGRISLGLLPHIKNLMNTICGVCNLSDWC